MIIDGVNFSLLRDYDQEKRIFHRLTFEGKVKYLRARVQMILLDPAKSIIKGEPLRTDLGFILTTAICAGISAAGTFLNGGRPGRGKDKECFLEFIKTYMDPILMTDIRPGLTWATWLYESVRCGMAHGYAIEDGGIEFEVPSYVLKKPCGPEIDPKRLLEDFEDGFSRYLQHVAKNGRAGKLGDKFEKRFDQIFHD